MRVQFEFTIDDVVDVQIRALRRSRAARAWRRWDLVTTSLLTGVLLFALIPTETIGKIITGLFGLVLGALLYPAINESTVKRRLRKLCEENAGSEQVFICEVELNESGVHTRQNSMEIIYAWDNVKEIQETKDSVDIYAEKGGSVVVRKRAFREPEEQQQFIDLATQYLKTAHQAPQLNRSS